ncbi:MAG: hypothetical protein FJ150_10670 [Euryarchaeota archaeon]|nr:hypothetical protein [Euryarchaeota archaeon]
MATFKYPANIDGSSDHMRFKFFKYEPPITSPSSKSVDYERSGVGKTPVGNQIVVTMPSDISTSIRGEWGPKGMPGLARAALGTIGGSANFLSKLGSDKKEDFMTLLTGGIGSFASGVAGGLVEDGLKALVDAFNAQPGFGTTLSASEVLSSVTGSIINPNTELLYGGTGLRGHGYKFKMIAFTPGDADNMLNIAKEFKIRALPKGSDQAALGLKNRNFLGVPDVCQVSFHVPGGDENQYLPRYKLSAIKSVNVDYITEGQYLSYGDDKPIGIEISLEFMELKLLFSEQMDGSNSYR